jgi:predicted dehydrogenase
MTTEELRVYVIGTRRAGMIHARNYANAVPGARLVALCSSNTEILERASSGLEVKNTSPAIETH